MFCCWVDGWRIGIRSVLSLVCCGALSFFRLSVNVRAVSSLYLALFRAILMEIESTVCVCVCIVRYYCVHVTVNCDCICSNSRLYFWRSTHTHAHNDIALARIHTILFLFLLKYVQKWLFWFVIAVYLDCYCSSSSLFRLLLFCFVLHELCCAILDKRCAK